jgi:hypothetical protein
VAEHPFLMVGGPKKAEPEVREPRQPRGPAMTVLTHGSNELRNHAKNGLQVAISSRTERPRRPRRRTREQRPANSPTAGQRPSGTASVREGQDARRPSAALSGTRTAYLVRAKPRSCTPQRTVQDQRRPNRTTQRMTKELFGEDVERNARRNQTEKKKGLGLGRLVRPLGRSDGKQMKRPG